MGCLKFTQPGDWDAIEAHMAGGRGERFAFARTRQLSTSGQGPVLEVMGVELIDDHDVVSDGSGWHLANAALDRVHNAAVSGGHGLVEFHNHSLGPPAFSPTDEDGLTPMADYVTAMLPDRAYCAGVFAGGRVYVDYWCRTTDGLQRGRFRSVTVLGDHLRLLNAPLNHGADRLARQAAFLGGWGNSTLLSLRAAVVGAGGTGSHAALALAYLGVGDVLILDDDYAETTNLNRLVTAGQADIGSPKNLVARRRMREVDPAVRVTAMPALSPVGAHPELEDVDLIIGCVDHDGPRDRLNQIALDTATPYIDVATGIDSTTSPPTVGGRVVLVVPGGPCLHCLRELDPAEISRWVKTPEQRALDREHGYGAPEANPAVVHLNGIAVHVALAELVAWVSGHRPPAQYLDIDLSGALARADSPPGCRVAPRRPATPLSGCIGCNHRQVDARAAAWGSVGAPVGH